MKKAKTATEASAATIRSSIRRGHMNRIAKAQEGLRIAVAKYCADLDRFIFLADPDDADDKRLEDWQPIADFQVVAQSFHDQINEVLYPQSPEE